MMLINLSTSSWRNIFFGKIISGQVIHALTQPSDVVLNLLLPTRFGSNLTFLVTRKISSWCMFFKQRTTSVILLRSKVCMLRASSRACSPWGDGDWVIGLQAGPGQRVSLTGIFRTAVLRNKLVSLSFAVKTVNSWNPVFLLYLRGLHHWSSGIVNKIFSGSKEIGPLTKNWSLLF